MMIQMNKSLKVILATGPVDLRKSFNGLYTIASDDLGESPEDGALFVFSNRSRNRIKVLCFDGTGCWVSTKRLEQGTFSWPAGIDTESGKLSLAPEALSLLLDGVDLKKGSFKPWYQR